MQPDKALLSRHPRLASSVPISFFSCSTRLFFLLCLGFVLLATSGCVTRKTANIHYGILTSHPLATQAGLKILDQGGNAYDAALAASGVLAVVQPRTAGLAGCSQWLLKKAAREIQVLDATCTAPQYIEPKLQLKASGSRTWLVEASGAQAAAVPGHPGGLTYIAEHFSQMPLKSVFEDAIRLAFYGFRADQETRKLLGLHGDAVVKQPALAKTLAYFAKNPSSGFYHRETAKALVRDFNQAGVPWSKIDLKQYQVALRQPLQFDLEDSQLYFAPAPSAKGAILKQVFAIAEQLEWQDISAAQKRFQLGQVLRAGFEKLPQKIGDPAFVTVHLENQFAEDYIEAFAYDIQTTYIIAGTTLPASIVSATNGMPQTNASVVAVVDGYGNMIAGAISNQDQGRAGFFSPSTGLLLNTGLTTFHQTQLTPRHFITDSVQNGLSAGKRPVNLLSPVIKVGATVTDIYLAGDDTESISTLFWQLLPEPIQLDSETLVYDPLNDQFAQDTATKTTIAPGTLSITRDGQVSGALGMFHNGQIIAR